MKSYRKVKDAVVYNTLECSFSLFISYIINVAVIGTFAYYASKKQVEETIDLYNADKVLKATFGTTAKYIWAIGLLAAG